MFGAERHPWAQRKWRKILGLPRSRLAPARLSTTLPPLCSVALHFLLRPRLHTLASSARHLLVPLRNQSVSLFPERLDLLIFRAQRLLHLAQRLLERLVPLRELHKVGLDLAACGVAACVCALEREVKAGGGGCARGDRRGRGPVEAASLAALSGGEAEAEGTALAREPDDGVGDGRELA